MEIFKREGRIFVWHYTFQFSKTRPVVRGFFVDHKKYSGHPNFLRKTVLLGPPQLLQFIPTGLNSIWWFLGQNFPKINKGLLGKSLVNKNLHIQNIFYPTFDYISLCRTFSANCSFQKKTKQIHDLANKWLQLNFFFFEDKNFKLFFFNAICNPRPAVCMFFFWWIC